jgi:two-component system sensor histidine kinase/response regulator
MISAQCALSDSATQRRVDAICAQHLNVERHSVNRLFVWLLLIQWALAIVLALWVSPYAWEGKTRTIHLHVQIAIILGAFINILPIALLLRRPDWVATRFVVAVAQMLWSALLIHLTGGRIETHFHVFGSLAFLAFYKDWRLLVVATAVIGADHLARGLFFPESVYGFPVTEWWRFAEHVTWVVFEDVVLVLSCANALAMHREVAQREVQLETSHAAAARLSQIHTEQLETEIIERKAHAEELRRARTVAEDASRVKGEFLANMSHEIRTPMNGVLGMLDLLGATALTPEQSELTDTARHSADGLLTIIDDILDFSKIEAGKLELESIAFDPAQIVEEVVALLAARAHAKGLEIVSFTQQALPKRVRGDPNRLRQVLLNLVGNAIKFTERGEVLVRVESIGQSAGVPSLRFRIVDTGIGISEQACGRLFQPFMQADGSTTRRFGGTGLGLSISRRLVELMGGEITVASEPGSGSTFSFTAHLPEVAGSEELTPMPEKLGTLKVLIVDDNATNRFILEHHLAAWGIPHASVADADRALATLDDAAANGRSFDLVLLDMQMPGTDGLELSRRMSADPRHYAVKRILLTSSGTVAAADLSAAGVDQAHSKPVRAVRLLNTIIDLMVPSKHRGTPPVSAQHASVVTPDYRQASVLLVEDNAINRKVALGILKRFGINAIVARDGVEACAAVAAQRFDLVFMDCQMPRMDGFEATASIRQRERESGKSRVPIVAMTANAMEGDREQCLAAGMDNYVTKPVKIDSLATILAANLSPATASTPVPAMPTIGSG